MEPIVDQYAVLFSLIVYPFLFCYVPDPDKKQILILVEGIAV